MNQEERRVYLIEQLLKENSLYTAEKMPKSRQGQERLLRTLINIRRPEPTSQEFLAVQDDYLQEETRKKGIVSLSQLKPIQKGIYLWQGDITSLDCEAIVNAANSKMTGCYYPLHRCIDNQIHFFSGIQLRLACARIMESQGEDEPEGRAKITPAFNLPCQYILHTVGPTVTGSVTKENEKGLSSCYRSCLELAEHNGIRNMAFCCISTGEFCFPQEKAAQIAVETVLNYKLQVNSPIEVIFNVFKDADYRIYRELLQTDQRI